MANRCMLPVVFNSMYASPPPPALQACSFIFRPTFLSVHFFNGETHTTQLAHPRKVENTFLLCHYFLLPVMSARSSSLHCFQSYIHRNPDGSLDASGVLSRQCYVEWMFIKQITQETTDGAHKYRRTLTNHVSGTVSGAPPFCLSL